MVGSLERKACSEFRQKMKENDTDTAHQQQEQRTVTRTAPFPCLTPPIQLEPGKRSKAKPGLSPSHSIQGWSQAVYYLVFGQSSLACSLGCFYIHLLSCCFLISEMLFTMFLYLTHDHTHFGLGPGLVRHSQLIFGKS